MLKCIIIDDEPLARSLMREMLEPLEMVQIVDECANGFEGLKSVQTHQPDLIFLDVQMPKINGFEMLELIENPPAVIFVTAFDEYAVQAFDVNAIDYLLKPIEPARLEKAIAKVAQQQAKGVVKQVEQAPHIMLPEQTQRVVVKEQGEIKIIPLDKILFLEAADDYVKVHTKEKYFLKYQTMSRFEQQLPAQQFVRIHRSYIVNVSFVNKIELLEKEQYTVLLNNGQNVPVSKSGYAKLKTFLGI